MPIIRHWRIGSLIEGSRPIKERNANLARFVGWVTGFCCPPPRSKSSTTDTRNKRINIFKIIMLSKLSGSLENRSFCRGPVTGFCCPPPRSIILILSVCFAYPLYWLSGSLENRSFCRGPVTGFCCPPPWLSIQKKWWASGRIGIDSLTKISAPAYLPPTKLPSTCTYLISLLSIT